MPGDSFRLHVRMVINILPRFPAKPNWHANSRQLHTVQVWYHDWRDCFSASTGMTAKWVRLLRGSRGMDINNFGSCHLRGAPIDDSEPMFLSRLRLNLVLCLHMWRMELSMQSDAVLPAKAAGYLSGTNTNGHFLCLHSWHLQRPCLMYLEMKLVSRPSPLQCHSDLWLRPCRSPCRLWLVQWMMVAPYEHLLVGVYNTEWTCLMEIEDSFLSLATYID